MRGFFTGAAIAAAVIASSACSQAQEQQRPTMRAIVELTVPSPSADIAAAIDSFSKRLPPDVTILHRFSSIPQVVVSGDRQAIERLRQDPAVKTVQEDIAVPHN